MNTNHINSYFMFNKPAGCITACSDIRHKTVMEYFSHLNNSKLHPMGRLDKDTEGLLIITDDGIFNQLVMHPDNHVCKTYEFIALGNLSESQISTLEAGVILQTENKPTKPCKIIITKNTTLKELDKSCIHDTKHKKLFRNKPDHPIIMGQITISEGKKHHIKRLLRHEHCCVIGLKRISIGKLFLDENLLPGQYRPLSKKELELLLDTSPIK